MVRQIWRARITYLVTDALMQLIASPTSPYSRKVRIVLQEKDLDDKVEIVLVNPLAADAITVIKNPLGKVPALVRDNDSILFDSPVICAFLDTLADAPVLLPRNGAARWIVERAQALGDGVMDAAFNMVSERRRPEAEQSAYWMDRWRQAIDRGLSAMEEDVAQYGVDVDLGRITYVTALSYLDLRHADIAWRTSHSRLQDLYATFKERSSFTSTAYVQ